LIEKRRTSSYFDKLSMTLRIALNLSKGLRIRIVLMPLLATLCAIGAAPRLELNLKSSYTSPKVTVCLADLLETKNIAPREIEKLSRYCRVELKGERTVLTAKDIELHAWAAGVIPEKIIGAQITITRGAIPIGEVVSHAVVTDSAKPAQRVRRGSTVKLVLKSAHMQIARDAVILMDAFPGETIDVRLSGTRKNLRARLVSSEAAELVQ
jgi:hypothetical protein